MSGAIPFPMSDNRSFISVPALEHDHLPAIRTHVHPHAHPARSNTAGGDLLSPSSDSYHSPHDRLQDHHHHQHHHQHHLSQHATHRDIDDEGGRQQQHDPYPPLQLPSLNGIFHDTSRIYNPPEQHGTRSSFSASYGGPSDENDPASYRLPLSISHPHDYHHQHHHEQQYRHQEHHSYQEQHSHPSYRHGDHYSARPSSSNTNYTHTHPHPDSQMHPNMIYSADPSYARPFPSPQVYPQQYANSHSSTSRSPRTESSSKLQPTEHQDDAQHSATSSRPSNKRREKPKIDLAPDQPLTTQGKPRARVYVACIQCRTRKIRCDGAKPVCHNCSRRTTTTASGPSSSTSSVNAAADALGPCSYDSAPKRRGPDKNPGSRQRVSQAQREIAMQHGVGDGVKVRRRRRRDTSATRAVSISGEGSTSAHAQTAHTQDSDSVHGLLDMVSNKLPSTVMPIVNDVPTHAAAHSPVALPSLAINADMNTGTQLTGHRPHNQAHLLNSSQPVPSMPVQVNNPSTSNMLGSPEMYRAHPHPHAVHGQGQAHGHGLAHRPLVVDPSAPSPSRREFGSVPGPGPSPHNHLLQPVRDARNVPHGDPTFDAVQHIATGPDSQFPSLSSQLPMQPQGSGHHRPSLPRLVSPAHEYQHAHSQTHSQHPHALTHHRSPQTQAHAHFAGALTYTPYHHPLVSSESVATISPINDYEYENEDNRALSHERKPTIGTEPSVQFARETWWDTLLGLYSSRAHHPPPQPHQPQLAGTQLTPGLRDNLAQQVSSDLRFLFRASNYWFSFVNVPRFFSRLLDPAQRANLQPALILAALACANFIRSSEQESGRDGRNWALMLLDRAQGALEASVNSQWIDESLVQASWMIAFFEISAHPMHNTMRVRGALSMLDNLVRSLSLSSLDHDDQRASRFNPRTVPSVASSQSNSYSPTHASWTAAFSSTAALPPSGSGIPPVPHQSLLNKVPSSPSTNSPSSRPACPCSSLTLGNNWTHSQELTPLWLMTPAWTADASDAETRKEECRRLVWSAVTLVAGYTSFTAANNSPPTMDLFLMEPTNYALLFPGETLLADSPHSPSPDTGSKHTVWALYARTMLVWHSCMRARWDANFSDANKAEFAVQAWLEIDRIEKALDQHTCGIERAFLFQGREYLFNARMCISYEFSKFIPQATADANLAFHRKKAEDWLTHQASVAKQTMFGLQAVTGQPNVTFARRPFFVFWFMSQVSRALLLWSRDKSMTVALDVSKALLGPIEYLMSMWPCPDQQRRYRELRANLDHACYMAGVPPPSPTSASSPRSHIAP